MKLKRSKKFSVKTSEKFEEYEYEIASENMGMIFEILRSNMYSNPIGSICREISSNGRDAHREANVPTRPIEIAINDSIWFEGETTIVFEDFGVGISPDRMANVFIKYGSSTKRKDNIQTGGFGLGAKTPFSYVDSFAITTRYNGTEYTYMTAVEDNQKGKMFLIDEKATKKSNGTQVIVPMKEGDREKFEKEVYRATGFWKVKPKYINFESKFSRKKIMSYKGTEIVENAWTDSSGYERNLIGGYNLLIDEIVYPINATEIDECLSSDVTVLIRFKTGDLELSPNRETVRYVPKTVKAIKEKVKEFKKFFEIRLEEHFNKISTYWEACIEAHNMCENYGSACPVPYAKEVLDLDNKEKYTYKGKVLKWGLDKLNSFSFRLIQEDTRPVGLNKIREEFKNYPLIYMDAKKLSAQKNRTLFNESEGFILIILGDDEKALLKKFKESAFDMQKHIAKEVRKVVNHIKALNEEYDFDITNYTDIEKTATNKKVNFNEYKSVKCRIFVPEERCGVDKWGDVEKIQDYQTEILVYPHKRTANISVEDSNLIDSVSFLVEPVDTLKDIYKDGTQRRYRRRYYNNYYNNINKDLNFKIQYVGDMGYAVIFVAKRFMKNFKGFKTLDDIMKYPLVQERIKRQININEFEDFNYSERIKKLNTIEYPNFDLNVALTHYEELLESLPSGTTQHVPNEYLVMYEAEFRAEFEEAEKLVKQIKNQYPLIKYFINDADGYDTDDDDDDKNENKERKLFEGYVQILHSKPKNGKKHKAGTKTKITQTQKV